MRRVYECDIGASKLLVLDADDEPIDCLYTSADGKDDPNAIYFAKIDRIVKGVGGYFVDIGAQKAFLRTKKHYKDGFLLPLQVVQSSNNDKPIRLRDQIDYRGEFIVLTPDRPGIHQSRSLKKHALPTETHDTIARILPENAGVILRSESRYASLDEVIEDLKFQLERFKAVNSASKIGIISPANTGEKRAREEWGDIDFERVKTLPDNICENLSNILLMPLMAAGGEIFIEATRALISVDVNTGKNLSPDAPRVVNQALLNILPDFLLLSGWAGQLVIDLAPMPHNTRKPFDESLQAAFKKVGLNVTSYGFSSMGLWEGVIRYHRRPLPPNVFDLLS